MGERPVRVMLADDHRIVREGLRWMLEQEQDVEIVGEASSGEELLALVGAAEADVVLLDVRMPGLTGLETLERLGDAAQPRIIVLSMHKEPAYVRRAVELGAAGYLLKSTSRDELLLALRLVAEGKGYLQGELTSPLLEHVSGRPAADATPVLSPRMLQILRLVADGLANKQLARLLGISEATVKTHLKELYAKLGVGSRAEAVAAGLRLGLIE